MSSHSSSRELPIGAAKLCQDIGALLNNRESSDIQFKVGGGISTQGNGDTIHNNESAIETFYAHSLILRCRSSYFATMLDEEKSWKESSNGIIYKPNISPKTFQEVLLYIYTGKIGTSENIIELIAAADEMDFEELSTECQNELIRTAEYTFSDKKDRSTKQDISVDFALHTRIIPALNLAISHSLFDFSEELLKIILPRMSVITKSPTTYNTFVNGISSEVLIKIMVSDDLALKERNIWDLALSWACHQTELSKSAVQACLRNSDDDKEEDEEPSNDGIVINDSQLEHLKNTLAPLLPGIRFSLLGLEDYKRMVNALIYILPRQQFLKVNQYFLNPDDMDLLDEPRSFSYSKIVVEPTVWNILTKSILETGGIARCHFPNDLKFSLLFRASEHDFLTSTFHRRCDKKGPTVVIVRSTEGHIFGGVNFNHWKSTNISTYSRSNHNFLFALPDGQHRKDPVIFKIKDSHTQYSSVNNLKYGPMFGSFGNGSDLCIFDSANTNDHSHSHLPSCYDGDGASNIALAGSEYFTVSDYEVFAISR